MASENVKRSTDHNYVGTAVSDDNNLEVRMLRVNPVTNYLKVDSESGMSIPTYDYVDIGYHGTTNNIATVVYKTGGAGGTTVATLTLAYVGGVPTTDDALLDTINQT